MILLQSLKLVTVGLLTIFAVAASANEIKPYTSESLKAAQESGQTVMVEFHAPWCTTCKKQKPVIESLLKEEPSLSSVVALSADYDSEVALKKSLAVTKQSTLVVFKGKKEVGRAMGITDRAEIKKLLAKGL